MFSIAEVAGSMGSMGYKDEGDGSMLSGAQYVNASASELCGGGVTVG